MNNSNSKLYRVRVPAGEVLPIKISGRHVSVVATPIPLIVRIGDMSENDFLSGQGVSFDAGESFDRVEVSHKGDAAIFVEIWIGWVAFVDNRRDNIESPTITVGRAFIQIGANAIIDLIPEITGSRIRRKALIISNYDPAITIFVSDSSSANVNKGNIIARVGREEAIILPISEACRLRNDTGAPVSCSVGEIYWTR